MDLQDVLWLIHIVEKLRSKHNVTQQEVEEVLFNSPTFRFVENGDRDGEDVYAALGQSDSGRYIVVYFVLKNRHTALVVSARDMERKERRLYGR